MLASQSRRGKATSIRMIDKPKQADAAEQEAEDREIAEYGARCEAAWNALFALAKAQNEIDFAMSMQAEMRGMQDAGWNTAHEALSALDEYVDLIQSLPEGRIKVRIGLSLYSHLSEASGMYEVPKNMMRVASGDGHIIWPFVHLVDRHATTGQAISPNANRVMKDLLGHAEELGLTALRDVILEAFDADLRNGYAHADYVVWKDGIRLRKRNGGQPKVIPYLEFHMRLNKAICFFHSLHHVISAHVLSYEVPVRLQGTFGGRGPLMPMIIRYDRETGMFNIGSDHPGEHPVARKLAD